MKRGFEKACKLVSEMPVEVFMGRYGEIYENSPWVAEKAWDIIKGPNGLQDDDNQENLRNLMRLIVDGANKKLKLKLLRSHPDLAGKLAKTGKLSKASTSEQMAADLDNCSNEEFELFQTLNTKYKNKFGFPFILAVKGYRRSEILDIFKNRVNNDSNTEFYTAMEEVHRIAQYRFESF